MRGNATVAAVVEIVTRPPTEAEAVAWVMRHKLPVHSLYRKICIQFYEDNYGLQFAESVRREVEKQWEKRMESKRGK